MRDFLSDSIVNITFRYGEGSEPVIPDSGTVFYTVLDHSGTPIPALQNVGITTGPSTFQSTITVPAMYNSIAVGKDFERRTILLSFQKSGMYYNQRISYRIVPQILFTTTPAYVRAFLGVNPNELPDEDIDLFASYLFVKEAFNTPSTFTDALVSGDTKELMANEAIAMRAAIDIIPSLQNRVAQAEKNGVMGFDRIKITDFSALMADAYRRYNEALGVIDGSLVAVDYTLLVTTQDTDPVTAGQT